VLCACCVKEEGEEKEEGGKSQAVICQTPLMLQEKANAVGFDFALIRLLMFVKHPRRSTHLRLIRVLHVNGHASVMIHATQARRFQDAVEAFRFDLEHEHTDRRRGECGQHVAESWHSLHNHLTWGER
jgi:hypothetical protein